jgi:hypothetical protein
MFCLLLALIVQIPSALAQTPAINCDDVLRTAAMSPEEAYDLVNEWGLDRKKVSERYGIPVAWLKRDSRVRRTREHQAGITRLLRDLRALSYDEMLAAELFESRGKIPVLALRPRFVSPLASTDPCVRPTPWFEFKS